MDDVRKNNVPSKNQVEKSVIEERSASGNVKILFIGNSMTFHGENAAIGWNNAWGMAASAKEKDYVHVLGAMLSEQGINADKCIVNVADWERGYKDGEAVLRSGIYDEARAFGPDIIIIRILENCPADGFDASAFHDELLKLVDYFNPDKKARVILSTSFWRHEGSAVMEQVAAELGASCAEMTDLGDKDEMKAIGKFEHGGVALHPGDLGMESMALRFLPLVLEEIKNME